jgi:hypothetical protein
MTTPAMVAIKNLSAKIIYQTCRPNILITLLTHPKIPHPSLPLKKKKKTKVLDPGVLAFFKKPLHPSEYIYVYCPGVP